MMKIKKSEYFKINVIGLLICLVPFLIGAFFYHEMPDQMVVHFGASNEPNGYATREFGLFAMPLIFIGVQLFMYLMLNIDPKKKNASKPMQMLSRLLVPVLSIFVQTTNISYALNNKLNVGMLSGLFLGVVFLVMGNLLPKCKYNYTIGIRVPTTLADTENWNRTHRLAGFIWVICSIMMIIISLTKFYAYSWIFFVIMCVSPIVYSYIIAIRKKA